MYFNDFQKSTFSFWVAFWHHFDLSWEPLGSQKTWTNYLLALWQNCKGPKSSWSVFFLPPSPPPQAPPRAPKSGQDLKNELKCSPRPQKWPQNEQKCPPGLLIYTKRTNIQRLIFASLSPSKPPIPQSPNPPS